MVKKIALLFRPEKRHLRKITVVPVVMGVFLPYIIGLATRNEAGPRSVVTNTSAIGLQLSVQHHLTMRRFLWE